MNLDEAIKFKLSEFETICTKRRVRTLHAFGSAITSAFDEEKSDIDLLVEPDIEDPVYRC